MFAVKQEDYSDLRPQLPTHGKVTKIEVGLRGAPMYKSKGNETQRGRRGSAAGLGSPATVPYTFSVAQK